MTLAQWLAFLLLLVIRPDPTVRPPPDGRWVVFSERGEGGKVLLRWQGRYWASQWYCEPIRAPEGHGIGCSQVVMFPEEALQEVEPGTPLGSESGRE